MNRDFRIFFARIVAYALDVLILTIVLFFVTYFIQLPEILSIIFSDIITFSYFIYLNYRTGQTYGKRAFNIKIVSNITESKISLKQAFLREIIWILAAAIHIGTNFIFPYFFTGFFMDFSYFASLLVLFTIFFDKNFRGLHDKIAGTRVISTV